jgi:hypothetical protein
MRNFRRVQTDEDEDAMNIARKVSQWVRWQQRYDVVVPDYVMEVGPSTSCPPMELGARLLVITHHHSTSPQTLSMASQSRLLASTGSSLLRNSRTLATSRSLPLAAVLATSSVRSFSQLNSQAASNPTSVFSSFSQQGSQNGPTTYFSSQKRTPTNTIIRFVPQQTAWIVERMGKFNRILEPGLAILMPVIDKIAYVKSLKENAIEIPSQSAITADNVTLELDGILYTRVFDAYKAR